MTTDTNKINRVINETSTKVDAVEVINWFSSSIEGQQHLSDMLDRDAYLMEGDDTIGNSLTPLRSDKLFRKIDRDIRVKKIRKVSLRVAAVVLPIIVFIGIAFYFNTRLALFEKTTYTDLYIPKGEIGRLFFQDGTEVHLNSDTRIRYPQRFALRKRDIYLDGEAYFNVASNKKRPFIVHSQNTSVEVLGTSFNIDAHSGNEIIRIVLDEGRTSFNVSQNSYMMSPGQKIEYNKNTGQTTLYNLSKPSNASLWKDNIIYFYDTPLEEVINTLERKYNVEFLVQSPEALNYTYTITTKQFYIDDLLDELQKIAPVKFNLQKNKIFVSI